MLGCIEAGVHGTIEFRILTEDKVESAMEIQQESMRQENVAQGVGLYEEMGAPEAMKMIFDEVIKDGCTIIAVQNKTDKVVGVAFNKLHVPLGPGEVDDIFENIKNNIKQKSALALIQFLDDVESKVNIYEKYKTRAAMEIFYVGTDPKYRGHQIGQGVIAASLKLARELKKNKCEVNKIIPEVAFGVFTSNYSQRIAENLEFEWLATVFYSDLTYWGKTMEDRIGNEHKTAKLGALRL
ncbi:hypothetical protein PV327_004263 [Microctonus hyperodae]|uniref:N-acetyltransferase domain-containing protein n=1 Tax=Microctonus hyperodae TaxID=165561 RepID=A0AA39FC05_MICHY|nr:hypothetical protein PV327_004263 [Microctonus hyperodae]